MRGTAKDIIEFLQTIDPETRLFLTIESVQNTPFQVTITYIPSTNYVRVIKLLRSYMTIGLPQLKELVDDLIQLEKPFAASASREDLFIDMQHELTQLGVQYDIIHTP